MIEIVSNKLNPQVIPQLHIWGYEVPIYLFCGGLAAGLLVISSGLLIIKKDSEQQFAVRMAGLLSPLILSIGMFFLFLDLENKLNVWRFYTAFVPTSPMSWGSWMLMLFYPFALLQLFVLYQDKLGRFDQLTFLLQQTNRFKKQIAFINVHIGSGIGVYTGILLATFYARPLWSHSVLGLVFLLSGMSSAAALMLWMAPPVSRRLYAMTDMYLLSLEAFSITVLIIGGLTGSANTREAMIGFLTGPYAPWFWAITIFGGIILPLLLETLESLGKVRFSPLTPSLVLIGGLSLRFVIVFAGQETATFH